MRDERIAMIYEGTNHIQALDLVGRKVGHRWWSFASQLPKEISVLLAETEGVEELAELHAATKSAVDKLTKTSMYLMKQSMTKDFESIAAVASEYLNVFGYTTFAFSWLMQCKHPSLVMMLLQEPSSRQHVISCVTYSPRSKHIPISC